MTQSRNRFRQMVRGSYSTAASVEKYSTRADQGLRIWEMAILENHFPETGDVLVVGCGGGRECFGLEGLGYRVTGVDVSEHQIDAARAISARRNSSVTFSCVDGESLPFENDSFDAVTLWSQVLGNVPGHENRERLLREARRVVRSCGVVSLSVHERERTLALVTDAMRPDCNPDDKLEDGDLLLLADDGVSPQFWHYFAIQELRELCTGTGFPLVELWYTSNLGEAWDNVLIAVCVVACKGWADH
jgi:SAM-dependent methyltransferase